MLQADEIIRASIGRWRQEDYEACEELAAMVESHGWKVLNALWLDLEEAIWKRIQKETDDGQERNIYRLVGVREGFKMAIEIADKALVEREEQRRLTSREEKLKMREGKNEDEELGDI